MNTAVKTLKVLRWLARSVVMLGIVILFFWGLIIASLQGFSPDGPPPGFKPLPKILFALLALPALFGLLLAAAPWISVPILAYTATELVWLIMIPSMMKRAIAFYLTSHALVVLACCLAVIITYSGLSLYAHRRGPAEFCVLNESEFTCENVSLEGNGFSVPLGTILPGGRCLASARPKGSSPVTVRCQVKGKNKVLFFTGGLDDSRKYYFQFTITGDLRGEYGAWSVRDRPAANDILISNAGSVAITNVVVSGLGFSQPISCIPAGAQNQISVRPRGPAIVSVEYFTPDGMRHVQSWGGWGREGRRLQLSIGETADLHFQ